MVGCHGGFLQRSASSSVCSKHAFCFVSFPFVLFRSRSYSQCLPSRFKKDVVRAAKDAGAAEGQVAVAGLERVVANIGASDQVSRNDIETVFRELGGAGGASGRISTENMFKLL